jgi:cytoskeletal protein RodZ
MQTVGVWLRQAREARGDTLKDAEAATHIRARFLEALEAGDFSAFPGNDVQVRGFLGIYARYLGLPLEEVVARYNAEVHGAETATLVTAPAEAQARRSPPVRPTSSRSPVSQRYGFPFSASSAHRTSLEMLVIVGVALIVLLAVMTGVGYLLSRNADERAVAAATPPLETVLPSAAMPIQTALTPTFPANPEGEVTLALEATEHVWVRVTRDGQIVFQEMMAPGQVETWSGQKAVVVDTGNGAGLQVTANGQPQGTLCERGQICTRAWGPSGEVSASSLSPTSTP